MDHPYLASEVEEVVLPYWALEGAGDHWTMVEEAVEVPSLLMEVEVLGGHLVEEAAEDHCCDLVVEEVCMTRWVLESLVAKLVGDLHLYSAEEAVQDLLMEELVVLMTFDRL